MSTENKDENLTFKIKDFWLKYEPKIVLALGFILVAVLAFEAGVMKGQHLKESSVVIEKQVQNDPQKLAENAPQTQILGSEDPSNTLVASNTSSATNPQKDCLFVASKNSKKYHIPSCQWAKRIKTENLTCFKNVDEAVSRGYAPDKCVTGKQ